MFKSQSVHLIIKCALADEYCYVLGSRFVLKKSSDIDNNTRSNMLECTFSCIILYYQILFLFNGILKKCLRIDVRTRCSDRHSQEPDIFGTSRIMSLIFTNACHKKSPIVRTSD